MRVLIDTHVGLWWLSADPRLSKSAADIVREGSNEISWSIASSFEVAVKLSVGKLRLGVSVEELLGRRLAEQGFDILGIATAHCVCLAALPLHHRDPFDRMLVAQAMVEGLPVLSADAQLDAYGVNRLW